MNSILSQCHAMTFGKVLGFSWASGLHPETTPQRNDLSEPGSRLSSVQEILIFQYGDASSAWKKRFDLLSPFVLTVG